MFYPNRVFFVRLRVLRAFVVTVDLLAAMEWL
jgi:hypothetical protein